MSTSSVDTPSLSGATAELFRLWCRTCWKQSSSSVVDSKLRAEATSFFASLVQTTRVQIQDGTVLETKGSHEQALAALIQAMSPIWSQNSDNNKGATSASQEQGTEASSSVSISSSLSTALPLVSKLVARRRALMYLAGALDGCCRNDAATLSLGLVQTLGDFLCKVAGPVDLLDVNDENNDDDDDEEEDPDCDLDEQLRDAAMTTMQILLSSSCPPAAQEGDKAALLVQRLVLAQTAVQQRCAVPELTDNNDPPRLGRVRSGLATLPRSRRSLCFSVLEAPLVAMTTAAMNDKKEKDSNKVKPGQDTIHTATTFVQFAASCLHGESDPRCLLQMLQLLHTVQLKLSPLFTIAPFPASEVFDAVAPYFPIQFTPPPNDVHGITREGLSTALWNVLSFATCDQVLLQQGFECMVSLSLGLFLDTLNPPPEDGPATLSEKRESLACIYGLLLGLEASISKDAMQVIGQTDRIVLLEPITLRQVVDAVWNLHAEASSKMALDANYQSLAHQCRTFISQIALAIEHATNTKQGAATAAALFDTIVHQPLARMSDNNPNDLAYLACLTSSGGVRCLQACLKAGLKPRVENIASSPTKSEACNAIAAIVAACKAGCDRMKQRGVTLSPHPLESLTPKCFSVLHQILVHNPTAAAVRAVESLLAAAPSHIWQGDILVGPVTEIMDMLLKTIIPDAADMTVDRDKKWSECCEQVVAHLLALAEANETDSVLNQEPIRLAFGERLMRLIDSCSRGSVKDPRSDRQCLAQACFASESVAKQATSYLVRLLVESCSSDGSDTGVLVDGLSQLVVHGGTNASRALQQIAEGPTLSDLVQALSSPNGDGASGKERDFGVSMLRLPPTDEELSGTEARIADAYRIILPIIPDYSKVVVTSHRKGLLVAMEKVLPPLNHADTLKLSLLLPFVSKAIQYSDELSTEEQSSWGVYKSYLADFALGEEPFQAKKFAAEALHGILANTNRHEDTCPVLSLMSDVLFPALKASMDEIGKRDKAKKNVDKEMKRVVEMITFVGLLGSAATWRGGSSAETSCRISDFLIDLATRSTASFENDPSKTIKQLPGVKPTFLSVVAADAFGSMILAVAGKSIAAQRLRYFTIKRFRETVSSVKSLSLGIVLVASHMVCSLDMMTQNEETVKLLLEVVLGGLKMVGSEGFDMQSCDKSVSLAALVKIQTVRPDSVEPFVYAVVTGVLRAYATSSKLDLPQDIVAFKILALQVLEATATQPANKDAFTRLKQAVIAILSATLKEKSSILRHAAVDVLNAWYAV